MWKAAMIFQGHPHTREMAVFTLPEEHYRDILLARVRGGGGR